MASGPVIAPPDAASTALRSYCVTPAFIHSIAAPGCRHLRLPSQTVEEEPDGRRHSRGSSVLDEPRCHSRGVRPEPQPPPSVELAPPLVCSLGVGLGWSGTGSRRQSAGPSRWALDARGLGAEAQARVGGGGWASAKQGGQHGGRASPLPRFRDIHFPRLSTLRQAQEGQAGEGEETPRVARNWESCRCSPAWKPPQ
eukprot:scaffold4701_cov25-Tisochrysis_lutea.AAC.2